MHVRIPLTPRGEGSDYYKQEFSIEIPDKEADAIHSSMFLPKQLPEGHPEIPGAEHFANN